MSLRVFAASFAISVLAGGCDGGVDCPLERPSCCENQLFGCGPFDLPQGCSCDDFFARSFQGTVIRKSAQTARPGPYSVQGTWRVALQKTSSGCAHLPAQSRRTLLARDRNSRVEFKLLGYTNLRGVRMHRDVRARGEFRTLFPRCIADIQVHMRMTDAVRATATTTLQVRCSQEALTCDATYSGAARRVS